MGNTDVNTNYINAEIYIKEEHINKNIRIINSFENYKKEFKLKYEETDNIYANEKEIKRCKIQVNGKLVNFLIFINLIKRENIILNIHYQVN